MTGKSLTITEQKEHTDEEYVKAPLSVGLPFFIIVIALLAYLAFIGKQWLQDEQRLPVQSIIFSGQLEMLDTETLEALVRQNASGSFFALDVNRVHALLEQQAWVYSASIRKRWPSKLYIHIVEQNAVAIWNNDLLLSDSGDSFEGLTALKNKHTEKNSKLPQLFGPGGSEKIALKGYTDMQKILDITGIKIAQLSLSERFAWQMILDNNIVLKIGRQNSDARLQRFIDVYPVLLKEDKPVAYVDLRYDTGLAVGWGDSSNLNNTNNNS